MQSRLTLHWCIFFGALISFVVGVELFHRLSADQNLVYQCRIIIDKDFSIDETTKEEEPKVEKISLYEKTIYGVLPRKQSNYAKIFNTYSANFDYSGKYIKTAILIEDATVEKVQEIIKKFIDTKIAFIIPHYSKEIGEIANAIISSGNEFFIQLPTQSSIPLHKKNTVSPFLANTDSQDMIDKLDYLIGSVKYAIGIANTSSSLITKSKKDTEIIVEELSQRGLAFLNINEDNDVMQGILSRIKLIFLKANIFVNHRKMDDIESVIVKDDQIDDFLKSLPEGFKPVPMSFKVKNASI